VKIIHDEIIRGGKSSFPMLFKAGNPGFNPEKTRLVKAGPTRYSKRHAKKLRHKTTTRKHSHLPKRREAYN